MLGKKEIQKNWNGATGADTARKYFKALDNPENAKIRELYRNEMVREFVDTRSHSKESGTGFWKGLKELFRGKKSSGDKIAVETIMRDGSSKNGSDSFF